MAGQVERVGVGVPAVAQAAGGRAVDLDRLHRVVVGADRGPCEGRRHQQVDVLELSLELAVDAGAQCHRVLHVDGGVFPALGYPGAQAGAAPVAEALLSLSVPARPAREGRSDEHTSALTSLTSIT